ncbi:DC-STAMP domain-containing 2 [Brachionus plicatilis]|uniref:DC-STAMP domain-containing 2 n=1 Tax=Brachionus plicatilis TaxID=10195 RepID=A0A3M7PF34_BRAPC|nr:DC-STAMP domain-containing 2 [Brachionus plicatilis]
MMRKSLNFDECIQTLNDSTENVDDTLESRNSDVDSSLEFESQIICSVEKNLDYIISRVIIEFLTINLYVHLKYLKRNEIYTDVDTLRDSGIKIKRNVLENVEKQVAQRMLSDECLKKYLSQIDDLFATEIEMLIESVIDLAKTHFFNIFSDLDLIKFRLKIGTYSLNYDRKKNLLKNRSSLKAIDDANFDGNFRLVGKCVITKLFFPALVYKADMEKRYKFKIFNLLVSDSSILNKTVKSLTGLAATCLLTYTIFLYVKHIVQIRAILATFLIIIIFLILSFGLVFDNAKFRCIVLLIIPFMASNRGRGIILMNCYSLCTKYVLPNALDNLDVLQETYSCNKKMMSEQTKKLVRGDSAYHDFQEKVNYMRQVGENVEDSLDTVKKVMDNNVKYINKSYQYLKKIEVMNINLFGNISTNCTYLISKLYEKCALKHLMPKKVYYFLKGMLFYYYHVYSLVAEYSFKLYCKKLEKLACPSFDSIKAPYKKAKTYYRNLKKDLKSEVKQRVESLKDEFRFEVIEEQENVTDDKPLKKNVLTVAQIYRHRLEKVNTYLVKINFLFPISFIFLIYSAVKFHSKYLKRDNFNNYLIGVKFYEIDHNRKVKKLPSVLPLNPLIKIGYTELFSLSLTNKERQVTIQSTINLTLLLLPVLISILFEMAIVGANQYIYSNTHVNIEYSDKDNSKMTIKNDGFLGATYRRIFHMFQDQQDANLKLDNQKCLPRLFPADPSARKVLTYSILILYLLAFFQAYIKRLRCLLCGCVYPDRDMERTSWLYTKLLALYSSTGLIERKKEKAKFWVRILKFFSWTIANCMYTAVMVISFFYCFGTVERVGLKSIIRKLMPIYLKYFPPEFEYCLTCLAEPGDSFSANDFMRCDSNNCTGFYCIDCFIFLDNSCKICQRTICSRAYLTDEVIERDSSDEDEDLNNTEVVKLTEDLVKIEISNFEKERAVEIIYSCFKLLYFDLSDLIEDEHFMNLIENSENLRLAFRKNTQLVQDLVLMVLKNYLIFLTIDDCFTKEELEKELLNKKKKYNIINYTVLLLKAQNWLKLISSRNLTRILVDKCIMVFIRKNKNLYEPITNSKNGEEKFEYFSSINWGTSLLIYLET